MRRRRCRSSAATRALGWVAALASAGCLDSGPVPADLGDAAAVFLVRVPAADDEVTEVQGPFSPGAMPALALDREHTQWLLVVTGEALRSLHPGLRAVDPADLSLRSSVELDAACPAGHLSDSGQAAARSLAALPGLRWLRVGVGGAALEAAPALAEGLALEAPAPELRCLDGFEVRPFGDTLQPLRQVYQGAGVVHGAYVDADRVLVVSRKQDTSTSLNLLHRGDAVVPGEGLPLSVLTEQLDPPTGWGIEQIRGGWPVVLKLDRIDESLGRFDAVAVFELIVEGRRITGARTATVTTAGPARPGFDQSGSSWLTGAGGDLLLGRVGGAMLRCRLDELDSIVAVTHSGWAPAPHLAVLASGRLMWGDLETCDFRQASLNMMSGEPVSVTGIHVLGREAAQLSVALATKEHRVLYVELTPTEMSSRTAPLLPMFGDDEVCGAAVPATCGGRELSGRFNQSALLGDWVLLGSAQCSALHVADRNQGCAGLVRPDEEPVRSGPAREVADVSALGDRALAFRNDGVIYEIVRAR